MADHTVFKDFSELEAMAAGRTVIVLGGFSTGYRAADLPLIRAYIVERIACARQSGEEIMFVCGATAGGIGAVYQMIAEASKAMPDGQIISVGIVAKKYQSAIAADCRYVYVVDSADSTLPDENGLSYMIRIAAANVRNSVLVYFGGGKTSLHEIQQAQSLGLTIFVRNLPNEKGQFPADGVTSLFADIAPAQRNGWLKLVGSSKSPTKAGPPTCNHG